MKTNNITNITDQQTITSMEIAEITGRAHKNVLQAIRNMEPAWENIKGLKFQLLKKRTPAGTHGYKENPYYSLTKTECLFVATKFNDEARAKLVLRWEQLEKERLQQAAAEAAVPAGSPAGTPTTLPADPSQLTRKQILLMALKAEEENEVLRLQNKELEDERAAMQNQVQSLEADNYGLMIESGQKDQQIQQLQERTRYLDIIDSQRDTVTTTQIAQDYGQSAVAFNQLLKGLRIQRKVGEQWILYADYLDRGYVANRMVPIHHIDGPDTHKPMTVWTAAGRRFLYDHLKKHGILPLQERTLPQTAQQPTTRFSQK